MSRWGGEINTIKSGSGNILSWFKIHHSILFWNNKGVEQTCNINTYIRLLLLLLLFYVYIVWFETLKGKYFRIKNN